MVTREADLVEAVFAEDLLEQAYRLGVSASDDETSSEWRDRVRKAAMLEALARYRADVEGETWRAGEFTIKAPIKGVPHDFPVAGWINGLFALDFRVFLDEDDEYMKGWVLTHLPTGFIVTKLAVDRDEAIKIADEIAACANWDFTETKPDRSVSVAIKVIFDRLGAKNVHGNPDIGPIWCAPQEPRP